jgi:hypothetical protein
MKPSRRSRSATHSGVDVPIALLRETGLDLSGVRTANAAVQFRRTEYTLDTRKLLRGANVKAWNRLREIRLAATGRERTINIPSAEPGLRRLRRGARAQGVPRGLLEDVIAASQSEIATLGQGQIGRALAYMDRTAVVRYSNSTFLLATLDPEQPEIIAEVGDGDGLEETLKAATEILFWADIVWEVLIGLLGLLGAKVKNNINAGKWIEKLADLIKRSDKLRKAFEKFAQLGPAALGGSDLLEILIVIVNEGVSWNCIIDLLSEIVDLGYWAIVYLAGKISSKFIPGAGQALLIADLGVLVIKLGLKFVKGKKTA